MGVRNIEIPLYLRNDTPSFVTWQSRLATTHDTPMCIEIHSCQFTGGVHIPNQFVPEIVSPLPFSPALVRHTLLIVYFFKQLISFIGSIDKCHTSVFGALIFECLIGLFKQSFCCSCYSFKNKNFDVYLQISFRKLFHS